MLAQPTTQRQLSRRQRRSAFTLLEVLMVLAILVILGGLGIGIYSQIFSGSKQDITRSKMKELINASKLFKLHTGQFPDQQLEQLKQNSSQVPNSRGPYIDITDADALNSAWGTPITIEQTDPDNDVIILTTTNDRGDPFSSNNTPGQ
jgi:general secretion pathway protein G